MCKYMLIETLQAKSKKHWERHRQFSQANSGAVKLEQSCLWFFIMSLQVL